MTEITIREVRYRLVAVERDGRWIAHAVHEETGHPFGIARDGPARGDAIARLTVWLTWQSEHAAAIEALQTAERAYHRAVAGGAFATASEAAAARERQKAALAAVDAASARLDEVRARKPA